MTLGQVDQGRLHGGKRKYFIWEGPDAYQEFPTELQSKLWVQGREGRQVHEVLSRNVTVDYIALTKKKIRNALFNLGFSQFLGTSKDSEPCRE